MSRTFHMHASTVSIDSARPLLIVDADEVILKFAAGFDSFLAPNDLFLDLTSYRLHGNVKHKTDGTPLLDVEVTALLDEFRKELDWLDAVDGAAKVLSGLKSMLNIVVLSNVTENQAPARLRNFIKHKIDLPLMVNSGSKGPAVKALAARANDPAFFIDDIPQHLASVAEEAPDVFRIHLIGDERLKALLPLSPYAHIRAHTWMDADKFIRAKLAETS